MGFSFFGAKSFSAQVWQDKGCRNQHARQRTHGIESLCKIQPLRCRFRWPHRKDVRVGGRFKKRKTKRQDVERDQEHGELHVHAGRNKHQGSERVERQSNQDAPLVGQLSQNQRGGDRHRRIAAVERPLHPCGLFIGNLKDVFETFDQWVCNVVRETPKREQSRHQNEWVEIFFGHDCGSVVVGGRGVFF